VAEDLILIPLKRRGLEQQLELARHLVGQRHAPGRAFGLGGAKSPVYVVAPNPHAVRQPVDIHPAQREPVMGRFPGEDSCLTLVWAVLDLLTTHQTTASTSTHSTANASSGCATKAPTRSPRR
jgi:hypothetical protein